MLQVLRQPMIFAVLMGGTMLSPSLDSAQASDGAAVAACQSCNNGQCGQCRGGRGGRRGRNNAINCRPYQYGNPDLFYNFYAAGNCGGIPAQMYTSPVPVPARMGHVYYTYQPFMPHELLYRHTRGYHRYYDGGRGLTRTRVRYW